jgi:cytochrome o ubiquinol oxidase operon protein cyoD
MNATAGAQGKVPGLIGRTHGSRRSYIIGLVFASTLTLGSFWAASSTQIYSPGIPLLLAVLAIAQIGIHLVFFLNISSAPDQTNNFLSVAFGVFVVGLIVFGSMLIMAHLNHMSVPMDTLLQMQR